VFSSDGPQFIPFSLSHFIPVILIATAGVILFLLRRTLRESASFKKTVFIIVPCLTLLFFGTNLVWLMANGLFDSRYSLPLHLCDLSFVLVFFVFVFPRRPLVEIMYFMGIGGAIQALATPALGYGFPHFAYFFFFAEHGTVIFTALYFVLIENAKFTFLSVLRAMLYLNLIGAAVLVINLVTGGNYMFLMHKPFSASLLYLLGPCPWYLLSCEGIALVTFTMLYAPAGISDILHRRKTR